MKAQVRHVNDHGVTYDAIVFWCPGCENEAGGGGLHMLAVNSAVKSPQWTWDGNVEAPTLTPSILTRTGPDGTRICHSYLRAGVFEVLGDCTHALANQHVPMPDLPEWVVRQRARGLTDG